MMRAALVACLSLLSTVAVAQTYRYVDPAGRTVISDTPPPRQARDVSKTTGSADDSTQPYAVRQASANFPVTLYTSAECLKECKEGRDVLNKRGIPFTEKMVQKPEDFEELKKVAGGEVAVPFLTVGKQSFRGINADAWNNLLDLAGYPKAAPYGSKPSGNPLQ
ncbi:MAG: glutaredoxin family protein [Betaproteobacteria bacterium]|nr:glutaredoxin family protein [Betaproteobacteria bacterium]